MSVNSIMGLVFLRFVSLKEIILLFIFPQWTNIWICQPETLPVSFFLSMICEMITKRLSSLSICSSSYENDHVRNLAWSFQKFFHVSLAKVATNEWNNCWKINWNSKVRRCFFFFLMYLICNNRFYFIFWLLIYRIWAISKQIKL